MSDVGHRSVVVTVSVLGGVCGVLAGVGGVVHGAGEVQQGSTGPDAVVFDSWVDGRIATNLGGEPAMSLIPNLLVTGLVTLAVSVLIMVWAIWFLPRRGGAAVLAGLSLVLLLVGGGFGPPVLGLLAALVAGGAPGLSRRLRPYPSRGRAVLAAAWPALFWLCLVGAAFLVLGSFFTGVVLDRDVSDVFVYALFAIVVFMPLATVAGGADLAGRPGTEGISGGTPPPVIPGRQR